MLNCDLCIGISFNPHLPEVSAVMSLIVRTSKQRHRKFKYLPRPHSWWVTEPQVPWGCDLRAAYEPQGLMSSTSLLVTSRRARPQLCEVQPLISPGFQLLGLFPIRPSCSSLEAFSVICTYVLVFPGQKQDDYKLRSEKY